MMEEKDIRILLNKYYAGETDEVEENRLVSYFATADVPQDLAEDKRMFFGYIILEKPRALRISKPRWNAKWKYGI